MKAMKIEKCWGFSRCKTIGTALWYDDESPEGLWMCASCAAEWEMSAEAPEVVEENEDDSDYCRSCGGSGGGAHPMQCMACDGSGSRSRPWKRYHWLRLEDR